MDYQEAIRMVGLMEGHWVDRLGGRLEDLKVDQMVAP